MWRPIKLYYCHSQHFVLWSTLKLYSKFTAHLAEQQHTLIEGNQHTLFGLLLPLVWIIVSLVLSCNSGVVWIDNRQSQLRTYPHQRGSCKHHGPKEAPNQEGSFHHHGANEGYADLCIWHIAHEERAPHTGEDLLLIRLCLILQLPRGKHLLEEYTFIGVISEDGKTHVSSWNWSISMGALRGCWKR